jgi:hypothetical protein
MKNKKTLSICKDCIPLLRHFCLRNVCVDCSTEDCKKCPCSSEETCLMLKLNDKDFNEHCLRIKEKRKIIKKLSVGNL